MKKLIIAVIALVSLTSYASSSGYEMKCNQLSMYEEDFSDNLNNKSIKIPPYKANQDNLYPMFESDNFIGAYMVKSNDMITFLLLRKEDVDYGIMGSANYELKDQMKIEASFTSGSASYIMFGCVLTKI